MRFKYLVIHHVMLMVMIIMFVNIVKFCFNEEINIGFSCYFCILQKLKGVLK
jgi:hypothetical protein